MRLLALVLSLYCCAAAAAEPEKILVWPAGAPGAMAGGGERTIRVTEQGDHVVSNVHQPSLTVYLPKNKYFKKAVIVVPGGGHRELWTDHEGHNVARFLNEHGIAAYVLEYRLARAPNSTYSIEGDALNDLTQAMRIVRLQSYARAKSPDQAAKVGVLGFSAGGQLAALMGTRYDPGDLRSSDLLKGMNTRPDFVALVYPGTWPDLKIVGDTPPMFLLCGSDDRPEVIAGVIGIYQKLREVKVPAELHLYDGVPHGFGLRASNRGPIAQWPQVFVDWLEKTP